ncbi:Uu.00g066490.m01.CDS01 [Anthostomella pinea]|uniref:Uu.00g066490.m01.CDS01 n=1 Tax=Anthostomella pinea TaxID=933095 RepID=A0AAI8VUR9_9PEZI|nr:Uu.00g066490.m01.CDS01 [Anthostomella pinea]
MDGATLPNMHPESVVDLIVGIAALQRIAESPEEPTEDDIETCTHLITRIQEMILGLQVCKDFIDESLEEKQQQQLMTAARDRGTGVQEDDELGSLHQKKDTVEGLIKELYKMRTAAIAAAGDADDVDDADDEDGGDDNAAVVFACTRCNARHGRLATHRQHLRMRHPGLSCRHPMCGTSFATEAEMLTQLNSAHIRPIPVSIDEENRFACSWQGCDKTFTRFSSVQRCVMYHQTAA